jgi:hypothetical protein
MKRNFGCANFNPNDFIHWGLLADGNWADAEELCKRTTLKNQKNFLFALYTQQVWPDGIQMSASGTDPRSGHVGDMAFVLRATSETRKLHVMMYLQEAHVRVLSSRGRG